MKQMLALLIVLTLLPDGGSPSLPPIPPPGFLYHAVFPGSTTGAEDGVTLNDLRNYERCAGKSAAWVYFSDNWFRTREFPIAEATWIRSIGSIPCIRLMLRNDLALHHTEQTYSLQRILDRDFDSDLRAWAQAARDFGSPLLVEYGTEVNSADFPWNGTWNGGGKKREYGDPFQADGPERFRDAYRHIIQLCREEGAANISWIFHVNNRDEPLRRWNRLEEYYPGDEWIDCIGVSVYGAQTPTETEWPSFRSLMDEVYPRLNALSPSRPIVLLEFGVTSGNPHGTQAAWAGEALCDIITFRWPRLIAFSWWNGAWSNDGNPAHDTNMRLQDNPDLAGVFHALLATAPKVLGRPL